MSARVVIELAGVAVGRAGFPTPQLADVNWRVRSGEFWVVAGPHGGGKTALMETLAGLAPCTAGEVRITEAAPAAAAGAPAGASRRPGLVFEGGGRVFTHLTVAENIALPVSYHDDCDPGVALDRINPLITAVGLERFAATLAGRIGRAWGQRVGLARALALRPEVLLLDNPAAGMDPPHLRWWRGFLPALAAGHPVTGGRPMTVILTTDDVRPWLAPGRHFALVQDRRWRVLGNQAEVEASAESEVREWLRPD